MPVATSFPGIYIQEVPSGVRTISGVSTSITLFLGRTKEGEINKPFRCLNYTQYVNEFSDDTTISDMTHYVRLFFMNGGTDCYVIRLANGEQSAEVTLKAEDGTDVLKLTAKHAGASGEQIRAEVTYDTVSPEIGFNIKLFRRVTEGGTWAEEDSETFLTNLSMDPNSPRYAPTFITQKSRLANAEALDTSTNPINGYSQSGRPVGYELLSDDDAQSATNFVDAWNTLIGAQGNAKRFWISVDGSEDHAVDLSKIDFEEIAANTLDEAKSQLAGMIADKINKILPGSISVQIIFEEGPTPSHLGNNFDSSFLRITSENDGNVLISPVSSGDDAAVPLMLGTLQGGLEVGAYSPLRPAPTGITLKPWSVDPISTDVFTAFAGLSQGAVDKLTIDGKAVSFNLATGDDSGSDPVYVDYAVDSRNGNCNGVREKFKIIQKAFIGTDWECEIWGFRLFLRKRRQNDDNYLGGFDATAGGTDLANALANAGNNFSSFTLNVANYSVGLNGTGGYQTPGREGLDGSTLSAANYKIAYPIIDREVDLFNLLVLPPDRNSTLQMGAVWGPASVFCQQRRAFLLMDAPDTWTDAQKASDDIVNLRIGLAKDYSAIFYPKLTINHNELSVPVGPSGAIAGLMARIDGARGVWKAPAGTEADIRAIIGVNQKFSDEDNGILNPRGINTIRMFPNGIVNWGARTMEGFENSGSNYKYIPVRRLALFMEESLYRGMKWAVFEPNDEPLWAQIRLNVGAFMHNLFRQGAFQGQKARDAYFVKCDSETTTQNDINLGKVNIWVGFAPLKPAEFVVLYLQQMAGQIEV